MQLTTKEISFIIKVARDNPEMSTGDIVLALIERNEPRGMRKALSNISSIFDNKESPIKDRPTVLEILAVVCSFHRHPVQWAQSKSRKRDLIRIRQQYCFVAHLFKYTQAAIGIAIKRDHATALFSIRNAIKFCNLEKDYIDDVKNIIEQFPAHRTILSERLERKIENPTIKQYGS